MPFLCGRGCGLYAVRTGEGIAEDSYFGSGKGENYEEGGDDSQRRYGDKGVLAGGVAFFIKADFVNICRGCRDEKDGDIYKVGRLADSAIISVKEDWYQRKS